MSFISLILIVLLTLTCSFGQLHNVPPQEHSKDIIPKPAEKPAVANPKDDLHLTHDIPVVQIEKKDDADFGVNNKDQNNKNNEKTNKDQGDVNKKNEEVNKDEKNNEEQMNKINKTIENQQQNYHEESHMKNSIMRQDVMQSGALMRGVIVFVVLSTFVLIYFVCRHYRLASGKTSTSVVHKYGVRTRRTDMEMLPLPLDDDDDDDNTVFDINHPK